VCREPQRGEDEIEGIVGQDLHGFGATANLNDLMAVFLEGMRQLLTQSGVVLGDEDCAHALYPIGKVVRPVSLQNMDMIDIIPARCGLGD
jgi:hypothetical protein